MRLLSRPGLIRTGLVAFLAADLLGLVAFVYDQLFTVESPYLWVLSSVLVVTALPLLVRLADYLATPPERGRIVPTMGEKIP